MYVKLQETLSKPHRDKEFPRRLFASCIKRKMKQFDVEAVQKRQSGRKSVMHYYALRRS